MNGEFFKKFQEIWVGYRTPLIIGGLGILVIFLSCVIAFATSQPKTAIQFSSSDQSPNASGSGDLISSIRVDVEGAVVQPGVVELPFGSRVEDALTKSGGLTSAADTERIAQTVNRAMVLVDGAKLYFPAKGETAATVKTINSTAGGGNVIGAQSSLININSATTSELDTLPGIGPVTAGKIISNRPYQTLEELVTKKAVTRSVYEKIKDKITL